MCRKVESMVESKRERTGVRKVQVTGVNLRESRAPRQLGMCDIFNKPAPRKGRELVILPQGFGGKGSLVEAAAEVLATVRKEYTEKFLKAGAYCAERVEWHPTGGGVTVTFTPVTGKLA